MHSLVADYIDGVYRDVTGNRSGSVADYIPELARVDPDSFAVCMTTSDGFVYEAGDSRKPFALQSISKPFTYAMALADCGAEVVDAKVAVEPSGEAFNEISLEPGTGKPRNPMINSGAITAASLVHGASAAERFERLRRFYSACAGRELHVDEEMYRSEDRTGHRNRAIAHLLRSYDILEEDPALTLEVYFRQCSLAVTCVDLSMMAGTLADGGVHPLTGERLLPASIVERVLGVMTTCGMYDDAGDWVTDVGMPAKSGVGGGILAVLPGGLGLAVFSPRLDVHGASVRGTIACRTLSQQLGLHFLHVGRPARSAIRTRNDLTQLSSPMRRSAEERQVLEEHGHRVLVYELHGDLLFTEVETVIRDITASSPGLDLLVVDVRGVGEVAPIARRLLTELHTQLGATGCELVVVDPDESIGLERPVPPLARIAGLAAALDYCEERLLHLYGTQRELAPLTPAEHPALAGLNPVQLAGLARRAVPASYGDGATLVSCGASAPGVFLVLGGRIEVRVPEDNGPPRHLYTCAAGATVGATLMVTGRVPQFEAVALGSAQTLLLSAEQLTQLGHEEPQTVIVLLRNLLVTADELAEWVSGRSAHT